MAKKFTSVSLPNGDPAPTIEYDVKANTTAITPGMPLKKDGSNAGYVTLEANGATSMYCIAAADSTQTSSADGKVLVYQAPWLKFNAEATTPGNLAQTVKTTLVTVDLSSSDFTVDENDTTSGFIDIVDYDNTTDGNCECIASCTL